MLAPTAISVRREPWNKGKLVGQKAPLKLRDIWECGWFCPSRARLLPHRQTHGNGVGRSRIT
jgi:hypothetical protein